MKKVLSLQGKKAISPSPPPRQALVFETLK